MPLSRNCLTAAITLALWMFASLAHAGLDDELKNAFDGIMINATPVGQYGAQRRGVIAGGSISIRNPVVNPKLISFVPPSWKAGCNGIDLYGGSFSFINSAQFTQLLRSVAQAAAGYAFQLAVEGMCPTCAQVMTKLQKDVSFINGLLKNSCEFGKLGVNALADATGLKAWHDERMDEATDLNTDVGFAEDWFESDQKSSTPPSKTLLAQGNDEQKKVITGNVVMDALKQSDVAAWFAAGDQQMLETLMSLTGTVIMRPKDDNSDVAYDFRPHTIGVKDLIEGGDLSVYKCESEACLLPEGENIRQTLPSVAGLRSRARMMLFGDDIDALRNAGIISKMYSRSDDALFSGNETNFIRSSRTGIMALLSKLQAERHMMKSYAEQAIDVIVTEMAASLMDEMLWAVEAAVKEKQVKLDSVVLASFRDLRAQVNESRRLNGENVAGLDHLISMNSALAQSLRDRQYVKEHD